MTIGFTKKLTLVLFLLGYCLVFSSPGIAQFSVSERTYKKLSKVERLMQKKSYQDAKQILEKLKSSSINRKYELALVYQALGYLYYETNKHDNAINNFEKSLELAASPIPVLQTIRINLVQLYAITNDYQKAILNYEAWIKNEGSPSGDRLALGGSLYAQQKQYDLAIKYLQKAIASTKTPQESWYRTLLSVYYQKEDFQPAASLLQTLIVLHPNNKEYWKQLYTSYYLLNDFKKALSALELAYNRSMANDEEQINNLASLYLHQGAPLKAASLLERELKNKHLENNKANLRLLATAYQQAREPTKAADIYLQLAQTGKDNDMKIQAARLYMEARSWQRVIDTLANVNIKPGKEQAHIMKGMALVELGEVDKAIKVFTKAKNYADTRISANQWLEFLSTHKLTTGN